jgi:hypothetical protein
MKKLSLIVCLFAIVAMARGQSSDNLIFEVKNAGLEKNISVSLHNLHFEPADIAIMSMNGNTRYLKHINKDLNRVAVDIDLGKMKPGDYILKVASGERKDYQALFLTEEEVVLATYGDRYSPLKTKFGTTPYSKLVASFWVEEDAPSRLHVHLANLMHEPASIKIFDWNGQCVYREKIAGEIGYRTSFNFAEEASSKMYFVYVSASEAVVFQSVETNGRNTTLGPTMGKERMLLEKTRPTVAAKW